MEEHNSGVNTMVEEAKLLACPVCNQTDQLQRKSTVDIYIRGEVNSDGSFEDPGDDPEIVYETMKYDDGEVYYCLKCQLMLILIEEEGKFSLVEKTKYNA